MTAEPARLPGSSRPPAPPAHLSPAMRQWWRDVVTTYLLEPHHRLLLAGAATAWDRATAARLLVEAEGAIYRDRFDQPKEHPAAAVERQSLIVFARLVRELGIDVVIAGESRPPSRWRA